MSTETGQLQSDAFLLHGPVSDATDASLFEWEREAVAAVVLDLEWPALAREEAIVAGPDERQRTMSAVVRRERQDAFRQSMLDLYSRCAVTQYEAPETLEAAHILPYRGPSSHASRNGLLLRSDIHQLFDRHLLSIDPDSGRVRIARRLCTTRYKELEGNPLHVPRMLSERPSADRLRMHFQVFLASV